MRILNTEKISEALTAITREVNFTIRGDVLGSLESLRAKESSERAAAALDILIENAAVAADKSLPLCQDCGAAIVFLEIGQGVFLEGPPVADAVNMGIASAYENFYLRKSIVIDPLRRKNSGTNTPAFIHTEIVPGEAVKVTLLLKGGGSENMSALKMFMPTDSPEKIIDYIATAVKEAGPNSCPPIFLGIGIGGMADMAVLNSKLAVLRGSPHSDEYYRALEEKILIRLNESGVGPLGLGGDSTCAGVFIKEAPAHIATLPVALNMNCHSLRYGSRVL